MKNKIYEKYVLVKDIKNGDQTIQAGNDVYLVRGVVSLNGGMLPPAYQNFFINLIEREKKEGWNYLRPSTPIYNKC